MLERVLLRQTRLRLPGAFLDGRGVVMGARGLVQFASLDRLAAFLALYTAEHSLGPIVGSLRLEMLRSDLGAREIALSFDVDSRERMDAVAEAALVVGGFTFTGTARHFVQYRDARAPFGYDPSELSTANRDVILYHRAFTQAYRVDRPLDFARFVLSLAPTVTERGPFEAGPQWIVAAAGLGPGLISYLSRLGLDASVGLVETSEPVEAGADRRWLFRIGEASRRLEAMIGRAPGVSTFSSVAPGVAVETGYRHPVRFPGCPVFDSMGLVLFRGRDAPVVLERLPVMGDVRGLVGLRSHDAVERLKPLPFGAALATPLRLVPASEPVSHVAASVVPADELPLLRKLAYVLSLRTLSEVKLALTARGGVLWSESGVGDVPLGRFYRAVHPKVLVPMGTDLAPKLDPDRLASALRVPADHLLLFFEGGTAAALPIGAFVPLEEALLSGADWAPLSGADPATALETALPEVLLEPFGLLPLTSVRGSS